jgi:hypothetical protein
VPTLPLLVAGCFLLAALSLLGPSVPTQDSWSWINWGREVGQLNLDTTAGSSWKPLPVLFTTVFSKFGEAAPDLWLLMARAGGLLAILFAYRIGTRMAGRVAGVVAAFGLITADWLRYLAHGNVEPLSAGLVLGAIDRHQEGHTHQATALGALAALGRPELWPFLAAYVGYVLWRGQAKRVVTIALLLVVPALWLGGDWWGSGDPFHGSEQAAGFKERQEHRAEAVKRARVAHKKLPVSPPPGLGTTVKGAGDILIPPILVAALIGLVFAVRRRERQTIVLAAGALVLFAVVAVMVLLGYGGSPRFLFPAAGVVCVLAGIGVASVLREIGGGRRALIAGAVMAAATVPFVVVRADVASDRIADIRLRAQLQDQLDTAIDRVGPARARKLGHPRTNASFTRQLAWRLKLPMAAVGPLHYPAVIFRGPQTRVSPGAIPRIPSSGAKTRTLARVGPWRAVFARKLTRRERKAAGLK